MGTLYSTLRTRLLKQLRDPNGVEWSDDTELYQLISNAEQWMANWLGDLRGSGRFVVQDTITLAASTSTFAFSALTDAATKVFAGVRYMEMLSASNVRVPLYAIAEGDENLYRSPSTITVDAWVPPSFLIRDDSFVFLPVSSQARTIYVTYQWIPIVKTSSSDTAATPTQYDDLLVHRAAFDALGRGGEREETFDEKFAARIADVETFEVSRLNRGTTETVKNVTSRTLFGS